MAATAMQCCSNIHHSQVWSVQFGCCSADSYASLVYDAHPTIVCPMQNGRVKTTLQRTMSDTRTPITLHTAIL